MNLITENIFEKLENAFKRAKRSITIISPYVKEKPVQRLISLLENNNLELKFLTLTPGEEYFNGATDLNAIMALKDFGFEIKMLPLLHAKIYIIDNKTLMLGSANFTNRGLGLGKTQNEEIIIEKRATQDEIAAIKNHFWENEEVVSISEYEDFEEKIKKIKEMYSENYENTIEPFNREVRDEFKKEFPPKSPHVKLLNILKDRGIIQSYSHMEKGYYRYAYKINDNQIVKIMRSKEGTSNQAQGYEVFSYQITKKSAKLFKNRKYKALLLILEEPDRFVCLPTTFLLKNVLKNKPGKYDDYQFKIKRDEESLLLSTSRKQKDSHHIEKYQDKIYFKV